MYVTFSFSFQKIRRLFTEHHDVHMEQVWDYVRAGGFSSGEPMPDFDFDSDCQFCVYEKCMLSGQSRDVSKLSFWYQIYKSNMKRFKFQTRLAC